MNDIKERFHNIEDYVLYYGYGREYELSGCSMAVVEPAGHDRDSIMKLRQGGTIAVAYLSVMEIQSFGPDFAFVKDSLLKSGSEFIKNSEFDTYLADMRSDKWNEFLIHKALRLCLKEGYDGIFLDTIGDVETSLVPAAMRRVQFIHAVNFIKTLRDRLPNNIIIQNNGAEELCRYTSGYIDGFCWEGPDFFESSRNLYNAGILNNLGSLRIESDIKILILTENIHRKEHIEHIQRLSADRNFLYYNAPWGYTNISPDTQ